MSLTRDDVLFFAFGVLFGAVLLSVVDGVHAWYLFPGEPAERKVVFGELRPAGASPGGEAVGSKASSIAAGMSPGELAGQRIMGSFRDATAPPPGIVAAIRRGRIGGVVLFSDNVESARPGAYRALADRLQAIARSAGRPPLLIATDQESAAVMRVSGPPGIGAATIGRLAPARVFGLGRRTGRLLRRAGIGVDFAPVADVPRTPSSFIAERAFSLDWRVVARTARSFARGLQSAGVAATAKHYPGLGAALASTDLAPVAITRSAAATRTDLAPFTELVDAGVKLVMVSAASYSPGGPRPALLEPRVVGSLRRLGFDGVIVSDALDAAAVAPYGTRAPVEAANAGIDLLLWGREETTPAFRALRADAGRNARHLAAMRAAVTRILRLKEWVGRR